MRIRCKDSNHHAYPQYGGRGIMVCKEWDLFENFEKWALSNGFKDKLTLDRIDNNGNYCPENCRWATMKEQGNNRRTNVLATVDGVTKTMAQWADSIGISRECLFQRINKYGWSINDAVSILKGGK
jgi:hypothetical protein